MEKKTLLELLLIMAGLICCPHFAEGPDLIPYNSFEVVGLVIFKIVNWKSEFFVVVLYYMILVNFDGK